MILGCEERVAAVGVTTPGLIDATVCEVPLAVADAKTVHQIACEFGA